MKWILVLLIECVCLGITAQQRVMGTCVDQTRTPLPLTNITIDSEKVYTSNVSGSFSITLESGKHKLEFTYVGYNSLIKEITVESSDIDLGNIVLKSTSVEMDEVVITSNRFEQKPEDLTISIEVLKPEQLTKSGVVDMEATADQTPGVYIADGQANIRGGSGFSYGAGSRVLVLIDDLPIVSADAGDVKWDALPLENLEQIEVLKGASSALYGSSALNGVINIRTGLASETPQTKVRTYYGMYDKPMNTNAVWWDQTPAFFGTNVSHARKIKGNDVVVGFNYHDDQGFRKGETDERVRFNTKTRFKTNIEGLFFGLNSNFMQTQGGQIFMWNDADSGMYMARNDEVNGFKNMRLNIDPYVTYFDSKGNSHKFRNRYFRTNNQNDNGQNSIGEVIYNEYLYQKTYQKHNFTGGFVNNHSIVKSPLYGDHQISNLAGYFQADLNYNRFKVSTGMRVEGFSTDKNEYVIKPNLRAGLNYQVTKATFLRASTGQGYRVPTIAERYINTNIPGLFFLPNTDLKSESGYSAEFGVKQLLKVHKWKGYFDAALFWSEYEDMIEFAFDSVRVNDFFAGDIDLGFKAYNVENSRISGVDLSLMGMGNLGLIKTTLLAGYTYMNPINLNINTSDSTYQEGDEILKYRFKHLAKFNAQFEYKGISLGLNYRFSSSVQNIDEVFETEVLGIEIIPGVKDFRNRNSNGDSILDVNIGYQRKWYYLGFVVKNVTNEEYSPRPADPRAPRTFMLQLGISF